MRDEWPPGSVDGVSQHCLNMAGWSTRLPNNGRPWRCAAAAVAVCVYYDAMIMNIHVASDGRGEERRED